MKTKTRRFVIVASILAGVAVSSALFALREVAVSTRAALTSPVSEASAVPTASTKPTLSPAGRGLEFDAAHTPRAWVDPALHNHPHEMPDVDLHKLSFEELEPVLGWAGGSATDDEFGTKIVECRARYQRQLGQSCELKQEIAVAEPSEREKSSYVASVKPLVPDDASSDCQAFASCIQQAWSGREAPPLGDRRSYRFEAKVMVPFADQIGPDTTNEELLKLYLEDLASEEDTHKERLAYIEKMKADGTWATWSKERQDSFAQNLIMTESAVTDREMMIRYLKAKLAEENGS